MPKHKQFSRLVSVFHDRAVPEPGFTAGYAAIWDFYELAVPLPDRLVLISEKRKQYETESWQVFEPRYLPEDTLAGHLVFALKYEGLDLAIFKKLFQTVDAGEITALVSGEPQGRYNRRIWYLYEWLMDTRLDIADLKKGNYVDLLDEKLQFGSTPVNVPRHRVRYNLPGVKMFCPLVRKTPLLKKYMDLDFPGRIKNMFGKIHPDLTARAAAFLLLKDSKASYAIEGEVPPQNRAQRWGRAIGQAGLTPVNKEELARLQHIVIDNPRFTKLGWREQEGFVGEHDRRSGQPIPDHISAKWKDVGLLMDGLVDTEQRLKQDKTFDAVIMAAMIAFGFVFIHPFVDGNGRLHRYLIHHVLLQQQYISKGIIFPVSAIMLEHLEDYRRVLEHFATPRLDLVEWQPSADHNIEILNDTIDLYRYFDATAQAEFLYGCVQQTIDVTIPEEVAYLEKYDVFKTYLDDGYEMPDKVISLLVRFLEQGGGTLSGRARTNEFSALTEEEVQVIAEKYREIFL